MFRHGWLFHKSQFTVLLMFFILVPTDIFVVSIYTVQYHPWLYLHMLSNDHSSQKQRIIKTLTDRARKICGPQHLTIELQYFRTEQTTSKRIFPVGHQKSCKGRPCRRNGLTRKAVFCSILLFIPRVTDIIGRLLRKHDMKTFNKPTQRSKNV